MDKIKNAFWIVVGLTLILAIPVGLYLLATQFFSFLSSIDEAVAASIIAAAGTTLAAVLAVVIGHSRNKKREIDGAHREYKIKLYSKFIEFTIDHLFKYNREVSKAKESVIQKETKSFFIEFSKELTLWASPDVIKAWSSFRGQSDQESSKDSMDSIDLVFRAMRKDLGNSNFGLDKKALIMLFVNENQQESIKPDS